MHYYTVSFSVLKCHMFCLIFLVVSANAVPSVEFYFYDPYGTNGLVFVGDEGSLFCEAKGISDPVFTLTFNGSQIFDGKNVAREYVDRIQVEEAGTCLHINLTIADASLKGEYSCGVTSISSSVTLTDTFGLQVFESPHCRDNGSRRFTGNSTDVIRLECIHLKNQNAKLLTFSRMAQQNVMANTDSVTSITFDNNKVIEQFSVNSTSDVLLNFTCKIGMMNVKSCNINITALLLTSQSDSMPRLTKVKSSTCKSNVSFRIITTDTTTLTDENLTSSSSVAPISEKPANLFVFALIPILILVIIIMLMLLLAFLIRRHKMNKDRIHRVAVNHAFGGSVSKLVHPTAQTDLVPISNPQADSFTSTYDSIDRKPTVPDKDEAVTGEDRDPSGYVTQDEEEEEVNAHTSSSEERYPHAIYQDDIGTANQEMASSNTDERVGNAVKDAGESNRISEADECNNFTEGNEKQSRPMSVIYSTVDKRRRRSNKEEDIEVNADQSEERKDGTGTVGPNYMIVNKTHLQEEDIITTSPDDLSTGTNQQTELEVIYSKVDKKK